MLSTGVLLRASFMVSGPQPLFHARIERVAQAVAENVDGEDGGSEEGAGEQDDPRRALTHVAAVGDDVAPGRDFARQTGAEETEERTSVVMGKSVYVRVDLGCRGYSKKKTKQDK